MIQKTFSLTLDTKRGVIESPIVVVKGDTGNVFNIRVQDNGTDVTLTGASIIVAFRGAGGSYTQDMTTGGVTVSGATVSFPLYKESVSIGTNSCDIQIYTGGVLVTTAAFTFECRPATVGEDTIEADASLPILLSLIDEMNDAADRYPSISVQNITHGHRIVIENYAGVETTCDVMDGDSGVYVGSGSMPDGYNVQIDPNGSSTKYIEEPASEGTYGQVLATNGSGGRYWKSTGSGSTADYDALENKPSINSVTLEGNKTSADIGLAPEAHSHRNLLDNAWFTVNQRGWSSGTGNNDGSIYCFDRWQAYSAGSTVESITGGVKLTSTYGGQAIQQRFEYDIPAGTAITYSATVKGTGYLTIRDTSNAVIVSKSFDEAYYKTVSSTATLTSAARYFTVYQSGGQSCEIKAVKVEVGGVSTLQYDTVPNYAQELLKCQRYFFLVNESSSMFPGFFGYATSATNVRFTVPTPVAMRANPSAVYLVGTIANLPIYKYDGTSGSMSDMSCTKNGNSIGMSCTSSSLSSGAMYYTRLVSGSIKLAFSADL